MHVVYVSGIERGVRNPSIRAVARLAVALKIDASTLFQRAEAIAR